MEKPSLQSRFTLLQSKFFPAKIPFSKIQKKNLESTLQKSEFYFAKEQSPLTMDASKPCDFLQLLTAQVARFSPEVGHIYSDLIGYKVSK
jgi:hypothetical protein